MALNKTRRIIWLDAYIGQDNECHSFKRMFCTTLEPTSRYGDPLDILVCRLNENATLFIFVDTCEKAIEEIEHHHDKQIIFISSGSLGEQMIPRIIAGYHHVYSFYIFCAITKEYIDFAYAYRSCLQIFNNELDLLLRLMRDISSEIIDQGKNHLALNDPEVALEHFERSHTLEMTANAKDTLNFRSLKRLRLLNGDGDQIGLIEEAKNQIKQQQDERQKVA